MKKQSTFSIIIMWLTTLITFPVKYFTQKYSQYKEDHNIGNLIFHFFISLISLIILGGGTIWIILYLATRHPLILAIIGVIIWLYAYYIAKAETSLEQPQSAAPMSNQNWDYLHYKAQHRLDLITNVMWQACREFSSKIDCETPLSEAELRIPNEVYNIYGDMIFYLFRLEKKDLRVVVNEAKLEEYSCIIESKLHHMISSNKFKLQGLPCDIDIFGESLHTILVAQTEDRGQYIVIWVIFDCPQYQAFLSSSHETTSNNNYDTSLPNATWVDDTDF